MVSSMIRLRMVAPWRTFSFFSPILFLYLMGTSMVSCRFRSIRLFSSTSMSNPFDFIFQFFRVSARMTRRPVRGSFRATPFNMLCAMASILFPM